MKKLLIFLTVACVALAYSSGAWAQKIDQWNQVVANSKTIASMLGCPTMTAQSKQVCEAKALAIAAGQFNNDLCLGLVNDAHPNLDVTAGKLSQDGSKSIVFGASEVKNIDSASAGLAVDLYYKNATKEVSNSYSITKVPVSALVLGAPCDGQVNTIPGGTSIAGSVVDAGCGNSYAPRVMKWLDPSGVELASAANYESAVAITNDTIGFDLAPYATMDGGGSITDIDFAAAYDAMSLSEISESKDLVGLIATVAEELMRQITDAGLVLEDVLGALLPVDFVETNEFFMTWLGREAAGVKTETPPPSKCPAFCVLKGSGGIPDPDCCACHTADCDLDVCTNGCFDFDTRTCLTPACWTPTPACTICECDGYAFPCNMPSMCSGPVCVHDDPVGCDSGGRPKCGIAE